MANLPPFLPIRGGAAVGFAGEINDRKAKLVQLVHNLTNIHLRQLALRQLSKMSVEEFYEDLPPLVWNSFGTVAALLQEIISVYHRLSCIELTLEQSTGAYNAMLILRAVASHPEIRMLFLNANIPYYLYPFLDTPSNSSPLEHLRIASLNVVATLMKIATSILEKLMQDDAGLNYICATAERFRAVAGVLENMLTVLAGAPSAIHGEKQGKLLMQIISCYFQLSHDPRARAALPSYLPNMLRDGTFNNFFLENPQARLLLEQLLQNVYGMLGGVLQSGGGYNHMLMK